MTSSCIMPYGGSAGSPIMLHYLCNSTFLSHLSSLLCFISRQDITHSGLERAHPDAHIFTVKDKSNGESLS